jgi:Xaa-Pro dipeptidase
MRVATGERIDRLAGALRDAGLDAFFASTAISMGYLHGYHESGHERFLTLAIRADGATRMICPALSASQAKRVGIQDIRSWRDGEDPMPHLLELADDWNLRSAILAVDDEMPAQLLLKMQDALPAALFKAGQEVLSTLMRSKDPQELDAMRRAGEIADRSLPAALAAIRVGATEREVEEAINAEMRRLGGKPKFCIAAAGANGAEPHHLSDDTPIRQGDVIVLDYGCEVDGYQSDITRMVSCGEPSDPDADRVHKVVLDAHNAARAGVRPGVTCGEIDALARKVIEDAGYGEFFVHRTGHGIGMRGHEEPYIVGGSDVVLQPGYCFSVEPGIYLPGRFGVRIENIVAVTEDGHESLNDEPSATLTRA